VNRIVREMMMSHEYGSEFETLIEERIGRDFDGECHLTEAEARNVIALIQAGRMVCNDLNARIDRAVNEGDPVPIFYGIASLNDALRAYEPEDATLTPPLV
jgi:hypothetical protein